MTMTINSQGYYTLNANAVPLHVSNGSCTWGPVVTAAPKKTLNCYEVKILDLDERS
jgi:hypothetical protein